MQFHSLLKMDIDPTSIFIDRGKLKDNKVTQIQYKGDSSEKVDLVFIAEGYTAADQEKFVADAKNLQNLFSTRLLIRHAGKISISGRLIWFLKMQEPTLREKVYIKIRH